MANVRDLWSWATPLIAAAVWALAAVIALTVPRGRGKASLQGG
jgi:hypothetical protein